MKVVAHSDHVVVYCCNSCDDVFGIGELNWPRIALCRHNISGWSAPERSFELWYLYVYYIKLPSKSCYIASAMATNNISGRRWDAVMIRRCRWYEDGKYGIHHGSMYRITIRHISPWWSLFCRSHWVGDIAIFNGYFGYSPGWFTSDGWLSDEKTWNSIEYAVGTLVTLSDRKHRGTTSSFGHPK